MKIHRYRAAFQGRFHEARSTLRDLLIQSKHLSTPGEQRKLASLHTGDDDAQDKARKTNADRIQMCAIDNVPVNEMTLRQLRECVQSFQYHWVRRSAAETMQPELQEAVDAMFHRCVIIFKLFLVQQQPWIHILLVRFRVSQVCNHFQTFFSAAATMDS